MLHNSDMTNLKEFIVFQDNRLRIEEICKGQTKSNNRLKDY
jgi:hypothetical protein